MKSEVREFIDMLRNDDHIRRHFDMNTWVSDNDGTCGTVGCIAGTFAMHFMPVHMNKTVHSLSDFLEENSSTVGMVMGLSDLASDELFTPARWVNNWRSNTEVRLSQIPQNQRPPLETVTQMKEFAQIIETCEVDIYNLIGPDEAANTLEQTLELHPDYVNWEATLGHKDLEDA